MEFVGALPSLSEGEVDKMIIVILEGKMSSKKEFWNQINEQFAHMTDFTKETNDFELIMDELQKMTQDMKTQLPKPKIELIQEYQNYIDQMIAIADCYQTSYQQLDDQMSQNSSHLEYASGGECIHRGFLCPSPILDQVVGGCNRGKRIKGLRVNTKNYYVYHFDDRNKLIGIEKYVNGTCYEKEIMIEKELIVYGISYHMHDLSIGLISMETYDEMLHLKHYITVMPDIYTGNKQHSIRTSERYIYNELNQLEKVILVLEGYPSLHMLNEEEILCEASDITKF